MKQDTHQSPSSSQLWLILVTVFLNIMGLGLILPVLPFYATAYGADGTQVGLLFTAFAACQFLTSPVFGALSDRYGRRPIILLGVLGQVVAYLIMGFATSLAMLFVSRIFAGATTATSARRRHMWPISAQREERTRAYGLVGAAFGAGLLFGPALGGALTLIDPRAPAFGAAFLLALNLVFGYLLLAESLPPERRTRKPLATQINPFGVLMPLVRRPALRTPLVAILLLNLALSGFQANFAVYARARFGLGPTEVSALFVATGLANILVQLLLVPRLSRRYADSSLVVSGAVAQAAGSLGIAFASVSDAMWISLPVMTGGYSLSRGPLTSLVTKLVAPYEQGLANGGVQATISLAGVIGPLWAGFAFEYLDETAPYWTCAIGVALAALAVMLFRTRPVPATVPVSQPASAAAGAPPSAVAPAFVAVRQNGHAMQPLTPEPAQAQGPGRPPQGMLHGSLGDLGLIPVLRFLNSAGKTGDMHMSREGWAGRLTLAPRPCGRRGVRTRARPARIGGDPMWFLPEGDFVFAESQRGDGEADEFAVDLDDLESRRSRLLSQDLGPPPAIPAPAAIPCVDRSALRTHDRDGVHVARGHAAHAAGGQWPAQHSGAER